jgi:hypothetical protein
MVLGGHAHGIRRQSLIAFTDHGDQIDLLVIPPSASPDTAERAMRTAADPRNMMRASDIWAARPAAAANGSDSQAVWDNEGGSIAEGRASR